MKILYIIHQFFPEFYTGTERFLLNLASMMQTAGHHVRVVTYEHQPSISPTEAENLSVRSYVYNSLPVLALHRVKPAENYHLIVEDQEILQFAHGFLRDSDDFDLIHIAHPMRLGSFAIAAQKLKIPYVLTLTDSWTICAKCTLRTSSGELCNGPQGGAMCKLSCPELDGAFIQSRLKQARELLLRAKAVVSPSKFLASRVQGEYPKLNVYINPHGVDYKVLQSNQRTYAHGGRVVFGYCGSIIGIKGVDLLVKAFNSLRAENAELRIYGSCFHEQAYFECLKKEAEGNGSINFCGSYDLEESGNIYRELDVLVVPSIVQENYSMATHEALACGVPVIASRVGGLPEFVIDGRTGFTFDPMSWEDLAEKMKSLVENPTLLNELQETIMNTPPPMIEEEAFFYETLYRRILNGVS